MNDSSSIHDTDAKTLALSYNYHFSLVEHWLDIFGKETTESLLSSLQKPYSSSWIQVNTSKIDFDSLIDILAEMEIVTTKHPHFEDILTVNIEQNDLEHDETLPKIMVDRESAQSIALGRDVLTSGLQKYDEFSTGDTVAVVDHVDNLIGFGKAVVKSSEIDTLKLQVVAKSLKSLAYEPPITELQLYRRGYFSVLTPAQVIGVKSLYLSAQDNVLVMSGDRGDVAGYIAELTGHKTPITVVAPSKMQVRAVRRQIKRLRSKAIRIVSMPYKDFINDIHALKYSSVYFEPQNSRTAILPTFSSNLTLSRMEQMAKKQKRILTNLYRTLVPNASISYITHSVDILENEQVFDHIKSRAYYEWQGFPIDIRELQKTDVLQPRILSEKMKENIPLSYKSATIYLDPITIKNSGGFIGKFKLVLKKK